MELDELKRSQICRNKCLKGLKDLIKNKIPAKYGISFNHEDILAEKIEKSINNRMIKELDTNIPARGETKKHISWKDSKVRSRYKQYYVKVYSNMYINDNSLYVLECIKAKTIRPVDIVNKSHGQLLTPVQHEQMLIRIQKDIDRRGVFPYKREIIGGLFKCGRCKSEKTSSTQFQTRSADEPITTFIHCENCDNRWRC
jgi:DNA-directed RNA polymerase subunit M/transcription elongation factor TFIIS